MDQSTFSLISIIVTVVLALAGYIATYLNNLRLEQRKAKLERVNRQLKELYGPLLSLVSALNATWKGFRSIYRSTGKDFFDDNPPPTQTDLDAWCLWMKEIFMPYNEAMAQLVVDHADLLEESEIPQCLLDLSAHVAAYRPVIKAWENSDYSSYYSVNVFPADDLIFYATERFNQLKRRQAKLLGHF